MSARGWRRWLPQIETWKSCLASADWEAEGRCLSIRWGRLVVEITLARIDRTFDHSPQQEGHYGL